MSDDQTGELAGLRALMEQKYLKKTEPPKMVYKRTLEGEKAYHAALKGKAEDVEFREELKKRIDADRDSVEERVQREREVRSRRLSRKVVRPTDQIVCRGPEGGVTRHRHFPGMTLGDLFSDIGLDPVEHVLSVPGVAESSEVEKTFEELEIKPPVTVCVRRLNPMANALSDVESDDSLSESEPDEFDEEDESCDEDSQ